MISTPSDKSIDIVLACDSNYAEFVAVFIESFFQTNRSFAFAKFHLLTYNVSKETIQKISRQIPRGRGKFEVYDVSNIENMLGVRVPNTISICAYARLLLTYLLPNDIDKILYVDCDVMANGDLADLWNVELKSNLVAGVIDTVPYGVKTAVGMCADSEYINSGVLLINLKAWRDNNVRQKFLNVLEKYNGNVLHHDQGIINAVCENRKIVLYPKFNVMTTLFTHKYEYIIKKCVPFYSKDEYDEAVASPVLIHFTEGFYGRPWIKNSKHPYAKRFMEFHEKTSWKGSALRPDNRSFPLKIVTWTFLNTPVWCYEALHKLISTLKRH
jgi:lipopolysaccharide biosynthesis glycosyltransferase